MATLEDTTPTHFFFLHPFLLLSMTSYGSEYNFGQLGSAVQALSTPSLLPASTYLLQGQRDRESLDAVQALLSSSQNTGVFVSQHSFSHKPKTQELSPSQPEPRQVLIS